MRLNTWFLAKYVLGDEVPGKRQRGSEAEHDADLLAPPIFETMFSVSLKTIRKQ